PGRDGIALSCSSSTAPAGTPRPTWLCRTGSGPSTCPPSSPERQPAEHLWPVLDEPLANHYFGTLADLEHVVAQRCRVLNGDQLKPGTNFHWWPKPAIPV